MRARTSILTASVLVGAAAASCGAQAGPVVGWGSNNAGQANPQLGPFVAVTGNRATSVGILGDLTLFEWGDTRYPVPTGVFSSIAGNQDYFLGVRTDGTLAFWGLSETPVYNYPSGTFGSVAAGKLHAVGLRTDGSIAQWGAPIGSAPSGNDFVAVAAGKQQFSYALRSNGTVEPWGNPFLAQYGVYDVPPGTYTQIVAGWLFGAGLRTDGTVAIWGNPFYGGSAALLQGTFSKIVATDYYVIGLRTDGTLAQSVPGSLPGGTYVAIGAGELHGLAIIPAPGAGFVVAVGVLGALRRRRARSYEGDQGGSCECASPIPSGVPLFLGHSSTMGSTRMRAKTSILTASVLVGAAAASCGAQAGPVVGWGSNNAGQANPQPGPFVAVTGNGLSSVGIHPDGTLFEWGNVIRPPPTGGFTCVSGDEDYYLGVRTDGTLAFWGLSETPVYDYPSGAFSSVAAGKLHAVGLRTDGSIAQWGAPIGSAPSGNDFVAVAAGKQQFSYALRSNGTIEPWGDPFLAQFGVFDVPPGTYTQVVAGWQFGAALRTDGAVAIWGNPLYGGSAALMQGTFSQIVATDYRVIGLRTDGTLAQSVAGAIPGGTYVGIGTGDLHGLAIVPAPSGCLLAGAAFTPALRRRRR